MIRASPPDADHRLSIARAVRILCSLNVMDMNGHVSLRDPDRPMRFWINSRRASRTTVRREDIVPVNLETGARVGSGDEPPSEFPIHRAIMQRRADVQSVVHVHPDHIVTLSIAGRALVPVTGIGSFLPETTPVFDDANLVNTAARGEMIADALGDAPLLVLRGHGVVVVGGSIEEAVVRCLCAEENARMQYQASLLGEPRVLRGPELMAVRNETWTPVIVNKHWLYHEATAGRSGAFDGL